MPKTSNIVLKKRVRKPRSKDDSHYVDNKEFLKAFIEYNAKYKAAKAEGKEPPRIPNYIGECFMKIEDKFSHHQSFIGYPYREEMIADAIENCIMYAHDFDPNRGTNPFAYFSQTVWNAFIRRINKENKNKYITYKSHQMQNIYSGQADMKEGSEENSLQSQGLYDNIASYIEDYEKKVREKKLLKKKRLKSKKKSEQKQSLTEKKQPFLTIDDIVTVPKN